eukprot:1493128-Pyramimonas_sp.AAC.1
MGGSRWRRHNGLVRGSCSASVVAGVRPVAGDDTGAPPPRVRNTRGRPPRMLPDCRLVEHIVQRLAAQVNIALRRWTAARPTRSRNYALAS